MKSLRAASLGLTLALAPSCAVAPLTTAPPIAAAEATDRQAYALLLAYAVALEQGAALVRDPDVPVAVKRALGELEEIATPAAEVLAAAAVAYRHAPADASAAERLRTAIVDAAQPIDALVRATTSAMER